MSVVTNVIILASLAEDLDALNEVLSPTGSFCEVRKYAGGNKVIEASVWAGAFNHFDLRSFLYVLDMRMSWEYREEVQILVKEEHKDRFDLLNLSGG